MSGTFGKIEYDGKDDDHDRDTGVRNPERLATRALSCGVLGIEKHAAGDRSENQADAVAGLGEIDAGGGIFLWPQHRGVGIGDGFQEGETSGNDADAKQKCPERSDVRRRDEPESADCNHQETGNDAAFVTQLGRQPSRRERHQEIAQIVRELHPGGLGQVQVQYFLKVLVHHVNHPVAESPKGKQQDEEEEGEEDVLAVVSDEHAFLGGFVGLHFRRNCG